MITRILDEATIWLPCAAVIALVTAGAIIAAIG